jgi:hypothetical protein
MHRIIFEDLDNADPTLKEKGFFSVRSLVCVRFRIFARSARPLRGVSPRVSSLRVAVMHRLSLRDMTMDFSTEILRFIFQ